MLAVVEHADRLAVQDRAGEQEQGHVRAAPRAVHGEEAQAGGRDGVQVRVAVRHLFVGLLGGRIQGQRMLGRRMFGERHRGVGAVHRTGGGIHQVLHPVVAAALQDVQETGDVAGHVHMRVLRRVTHARLRRLRNVARANLCLKVSRPSKGVLAA